MAGSKQVNRKPRGRPSRVIQAAPNAPKQLVKLWKGLGCNFYKTAQKREINSGHVYNLIVKGVEPVRGDLRAKLFLSHKKTKEELERIREQRKRKKERLDREISKHFEEVLERLR